VLLTVREQNVILPPTRSLRLAAAARYVAWLRDAGRILLGEWAKDYDGLREFCSNRPERRIRRSLGFGSWCFFAKFCSG